MWKIMKEIAVAYEKVCKIVNAYETGNVHTLQNYETGWNRKSRLLKNSGKKRNRYTKKHAKDCTKVKKCETAKLPLNSGFVGKDFVTKLREQ